MVQNMHDFPLWASREERKEMRSPSAGAIDQGLEQALELRHGLAAVVLGEERFLVECQGNQSADQRFAAVGAENEYLAAVTGVGDPIDARVSDHAIDRLGERRMVEQGCLGKVAHRPSVAVRQNLEDAPLLDGNA